jgi:hypothetical protein
MLKKEPHPTPPYGCGLSAYVALKKTYRAFFPYMLLAAFIWADLVEATNRAMHRGDSHQF